MINQRWKPAASAAVAATCIGLPASTMALQVDAAQTAINYGFFVTRADVWTRWQDFKAVSDNIEQIDVFIQDQHRVNSLLNVWVTNSSNTTLWQASLADASLLGNGWLAIDTPRIATSVGAVYRLNMTVSAYPTDGNPSASVFWMGSTAPTQHFVNDTSSSWPSYSYAFRIQSAVPEPPMAVYLLTGMAALLTFRRPPWHARRRGMALPGRR